LRHKQIAERHKVYKVETVGECYVAATGIPDPQADHAVLLSKFAAECVRKMPKFVKKMEVKFGPDTGDLNLRVGMHS
jgi:class 3 adenylate cyclase